MAGGTPLAVALAAVMLSIAHPDHGTAGELTNKQTPSSRPLDLKSKATLAVVTAREDPGYPWSCLQ
jgi:hypothetical protein